jgi:hypothetical protein
MFDIEPSPEHSAQATSAPTSFQLNLQTAVNMGEYEPIYLAQFEEWAKLTPGMQFELVKKGIENKRRQLRIQYATTFNAPDFSKKPHLEEAIQNIFIRLKKLQSDEERLGLQYSRLI